MNERAGTMNNLPVLYRNEIHRLLEIYLLWKFDLKTECDKINHKSNRAEFIMQLVHALSRSGVPYILKRGDKEYTLQYGFTTTL